MVTLPVEVSLEDYLLAMTWWRKTDNKPKRVFSGSALRFGAIIPIYACCVGTSDELHYFVSEGLASFLNLERVHSAVMQTWEEEQKREEQRKALPKAKKASEAAQIFDDVLKSMGSMEW